MEKKATPMNRLRELRPSHIFVIASLAGLFVVMVMFFVTHGEGIAGYFYDNIWDTGMDFFHSLQYLHGNHPYAYFETLYPPLANLFFGFLYHFLPGSTTITWPISYEDALKTVDSINDPRLLQAPMLLFILFIIATVLIISFLVFAMMKDKRDGLKWALIVSTLCSYPVLFAFERGNIILTCFALTLFYIMSYDHENGWIREAGIIALAIAAGLKLYPAVYGLLLVQRGRILQAVRAIIYGVMCLFLPFLFLGEGLGGFTLWLDILRQHMKESETLSWNFSIKYLLSSLYESIKGLNGLTIGKWVFTVLPYLICGLLLLSSFTRKEKWRRVFDITLAMLLFSSQGAYGLMFFLLPLLLLIAEKDVFLKENGIYLAGMLLVLVNFPSVILKYVLIVIVLAVMTGQCLVDLFRWCAYRVRGVMTPQ